MYKYLILVGLIFGASSFISSDQNPILPLCDTEVAVSDFVIATDKTIAVSGTIFTAETIAQNSNVTYRSGSGTIFSIGMTGSLSGASPGFQIYDGSTLTVEIGDCP